MIAEVKKPGTTFDTKQQSVEGTAAWIVWSAQTADHAYEIVTDTFVVFNGKIMVQSISGKITSTS